MAGYVSKTLRNAVLKAAESRRVRAAQEAGRVFGVYVIHKDGDAAPVRLYQNLSREDAEARAEYVRGLNPHRTYEVR